MCLIAKIEIAKQYLFQLNVHFYKSIVEHITIDTHMVQGKYAVKNKIVHFSSVIFGCAFNQYFILTSNIVHLGGCSINQLF